MVTLMELPEGVQPVPPDHRPPRLADCRKRKFALRRPRSARSLLVLLAALLSLSGLRAFAGSDDDDAKAPGTATDLPTGMRITPTAARAARFAALNPGLPGQPSLTVGDAVTTATSPDGRTLLILTSGYNVTNDAQGRELPEESGEYVFVFDISSGPPREVQVLQVPRAFDGLAWNPSGKEFYVSGGEEDVVHVFSRDSASWKEAGPAIHLGHPAGLGILTKPEVAGLAVNASRTRLVAANYENDSLSVVDLASRAKIAEVDLRPGKSDPAKTGLPGGEYPFWVAIHGDDKAYVSSIRDREIDVVALGDAAHPAPRVVARIPVRGSPNKMILNRAGTRLYVACDNSDSIAVVDTATDGLLTQFPVTAPKTVFANPRGFRGSNPNSLALSPDERTLYVTDGGTNALAVIRLQGDTGTVAGLIPTGWYPNSVSLNSAGTRLYVVNGKSVVGPNPKGCRSTLSVQPAASNACRAANRYILQLSRAGFLTLPVPPDKELARLTAVVARNDHFRAIGGKDALVTGLLHSKIHHVIYIIKENRTYDQVLGDLERGNGDPSLALLPEAITPNHHQLARQFVTLDNFYDSGDVSGDGWNWSTAARATDNVEKTLPIQYADHGVDYTFEGGERNVNTGLASPAARRAANAYTPGDADLLPGTGDVSAPDGPGDDDGEAGAGYLWDDALRAKLSARNYGFFVDLFRYRVPANDPNYFPPLHDPHATGTVVAVPTKPELQAITDPYFRSFDQAVPDYWRYKEWEREFDGYVRDGNLPSLELVRFAHDHFGSFAQAIDGVNTVETEMADNDYALGLLVQKIAESPYKDDTLVFVVEDDAQDGPDHVDAHRSLAFVAGPYVRQQALVSERYTTVHLLRTIESILGIEPLGLNDGSVGPMTGVFQATPRPWTYLAAVPAVLRTTKLPLPAGSAAPGTPQARALLPGAGAASGLGSPPRRDAAYWAAKTQDMDFSAEDRADNKLFNQIVWTGLMGDAAPYPAKRDARNLRRNRRRVLARAARAASMRTEPAQP
jgi:DNA-binding beta-propeller fold protein YncE